MNNHIRKGHPAYSNKERNRKIGLAQKGKIVSLETRKKLSIARRKRVTSEETRVKMSKARKGKKMGQDNPMYGKRGHLSPTWKGGLTEKNQIIRMSTEYKIWRRSVFERDNYTCVWCGDNTGGNLNADHIKPFALFPELRFAIDNGRTLCKPCHKTTNTYGKKIKNYEKQ